MSFEIWLLGEEGRGARLPRKSDLLRTFAGFVIEDKPPMSRSALAVLPGFIPRDGDDVPSPFTELVLGTPDDGDCEISYQWGPASDPVQSHMTVYRPLAARWLWEGVFRLLRDFDLYMVYPGAEAAVVAHRSVPLPDGMEEEMPIVLVTSTDELVEPFS